MSEGVARRGIPTELAGNAAFAAAPQRPQAGAPPLPGAKIVASFDRSALGVRSFFCGQ